MQSIEQLYEMQKKLDARIIKEKGLEGQDLLPNTVLALLVEIGEMANEWRVFKHWSNDHEPRHERRCHACNGLGGFILGNEPEENEACMYCEGTGIEERPILREYIDCLHFFLSIANQRGWPNAVYVQEEAVEDLREEGFDGGVVGALLEMQYWLLQCQLIDKKSESIEEKLGYSTKEFSFRNAYFIFVAIGVIEFGFTFEQIAEAYVVKNAHNHERQNTGY